MSQNRYRFFAQVRFFLKHIFSNTILTKSSEDVSLKKNIGVCWHSAINLLAVGTLVHAKLLKKILQSGFYWLTLFKDFQFLQVM